VDDENEYRLNSSTSFLPVNQVTESPTFSFTYRQKWRGIKGKYSGCGLHEHWRRFDKNYMQFWFGGSTNPYKAHNHIGIYSNREQVVEQQKENEQVELCQVMDTNIH